MIVVLLKLDIGLIGENERMRMEELLKLYTFSMGKPSQCSQISMSRMVGLDTASQTDLCPFSN